MTRKQQIILALLVLVWIALFWVAWTIWPTWWLAIPFIIIGIIGTGIFTRRLTPR